MLRTTLRSLTTATLAMGMLGAARSTQAQPTAITFDGSVTSPLPPDDFFGLALEYHTPTVPPGPSIAFNTQGFGFGGNTAGVTASFPTTPELDIAVNPALCPAVLGVSCVSNGTKFLVTLDPFSVGRQGVGFHGLYGFDAGGLFPSGNCPTCNDGGRLPNASALLVVGFRSGALVVQATFTLTAHFQTFVLSDPAWRNVGRVVFAPLDANGLLGDSIVAIDNIRVQMADNSVSTDFDHDGKADLTVFRPADGTWYTRTSTTDFTGATGTQWGNSADNPVPGDYDGDAKADIAVFRPSDGTWYIVQSRTGIPKGVQWGNSSDIPVPGDYDGDGKTDIAVFRPSDGSWYVIRSVNGSTFGTQWGNSSDKPVPGDYDGDGRTDLAVFRPSDGTWYIIQSRTGTPIGMQWGNSSDLPVPGDYDGDGITDIAVFRPSDGTWYVIQSSTGAPMGVQWGNGNDVPVPADYDGDGRMDVGVFRPSDGTWYVIKSSTGTPFGIQWGNGNDLPISKRP